MSQRRATSVRLMTLWMTLGPLSLRNHDSYFLRLEDLTLLSRPEEWKSCMSWRRATSVRLMTLWMTLGHLSLRSHDSYFLRLEDLTLLSPPEEWKSCMSRRRATSVRLMMLWMTLGPLSLRSHDSYFLRLDDLTRCYGFIRQWMKRGAAISYLHGSGSHAHAPATSQELTARREASERWSRGRGGGMTSICSRTCFGCCCFTPSRDWRNFKFCRFQDGGANAATYAPMAAAAANGTFSRRFFSTRRHHHVFQANGVPFAGCRLLPSPASFARGVNNKSLRPSRVDDDNTCTKCLVPLRATKRKNAENGECIWPGSAALYVRHTCIWRAVDRGHKLPVAAAAAAASGALVARRDPGDDDKVCFAAVLSSSPWTTPPLRRSAREAGALEKTRSPRSQPWRKSSRLSPLPYSRAESTPHSWLVDGRSNSEPEKVCGHRRGHTKSRSAPLDLVLLRSWPSSGRAERSDGRGRDPGGRRRRWTSRSRGAAAWESGETAGNMSDPGNTPEEMEQEEEEEGKEAGEVGKIVNILASIADSLAEVKETMRSMSSSLKVIADAAAVLSASSSTDSVDVNTDPMATDPRIVGVELRSDDLRGNMDDVSGQWRATAPYDGYLQGEDILSGEIYGSGGFPSSPFSSSSSYSSSASSQGIMRNGEEGSDQANSGPEEAQLSDRDGMDRNRCSSEFEQSDAKAIEQSAIASQLALRLQQAFFQARIEGLGKPFQAWWPQLGRELFRSDARNRCDSKPSLNPKPSRNPASGT
ncbi:hypothetical protein CBR_g3112 [Chara braunii]|uniref:Uncharacterized protein n=1 Tax=Chara braunii TaxID=69332 RepID=A0A388KEY6_CHABU|nr:hypothetical protein CBR_g3112 [Chara braunii]|eukprot:GBG68567.1 hypothetical protein CBR_g3112 [Chara braunii]